jgi:hypothetical protein
MKYVRRVGGKSYDEWFGSRSPVTRLQFCGLVLLGAVLMAMGLTLLVFMWMKVSTESLDVFGIILLSVSSTPAIATIYLGIIHIKRAFAGNR